MLNVCQEFPSILEVLILVEGRTVYFGSPSGALPHYTSLGLHCPHDESPPDFFMRCVATDAGEDADRQQAKQNVEKLLAAVPALSTPEMPKKFDASAVESLKGSGAVALLTLVRREFLIRRRSKLLFKAAIARTLFMAILLGLLYWQLPNDQMSWQSVLGVLNLFRILFLFKKSTYCILHTYCFIIGINTFFIIGINSDHHFPKFSKALSEITSETNSSKHQQKTSHLVAEFQWAEEHGHHQHLHDCRFWPDPRIATFLPSSLPWS